MEDLSGTEICQTVKLSCLFIKQDFIDEIRLITD